jgi:hypothetical protein
LPNLTQLHLFSGQPDLKDLPAGVAKLGLEACGLEDQDLLCLAYKPNLREVGIELCQEITAQGVRMLMTLAPRLKIDSDHQRH